MLIIITPSIYPLKLTQPRHIKILQTKNLIKKSSFANRLPRSNSAAGRAAPLITNLNKSIEVETPPRNASAEPAHGDVPKPLCVKPLVNNQQKTH